MFHVIFKQPFFGEVIVLTRIQFAENSKYECYSSRTRKLSAKICMFLTIIISMILRIMDMIQKEIYTSTMKLSSLPAGSI